MTHVRHDAVKTYPNDEKKKIKFHFMKKFGTR